MYAVEYALQLVLTLAADTFGVVSGMTTMFLWITLLVNIGLYLFVFNFRKKGDDHKDSIVNYFMFCALTNYDIKNHIYMYVVVGIPKCSL